MGIRRHLLQSLGLAAALLAAGCLPSVTWLPDGKHIAYVQGGAVWLTDLAGLRTKLYAAAGETPWFVTAAPAGEQVAIISSMPGCSRLTFLDASGRTTWSVTLPGGGTDESGPGVTLPSNPWGPQGSRLLLRAGQNILIADRSARTVHALGDAVADARFTPAGELLFLTGTSTGAFSLVRIVRSGARDAPIPWRVPSGTADDAKPHLTADGSAVWLTQAGGGTRAVLADRAGQVLFTSAREMESLGPDDTSYLTRDGGWALIRVGGPVLNLNPAYNRLVQAEINWQMEDSGATDASAIKPEPEFMSLPVWSPDRSRFAVMTKSLLVVVDTATNAVTPLAKW